MGRPRSGIRTARGRYFATGSSNRTSPRVTMSARMDAVKTFVIEPISKTLSAPTPTATRRLPVSTSATTMPSPCFPVSGRAFTRVSTIAWTAESDGRPC